MVPINKRSDDMKSIVDGNTNPGVDPLACDLGALDKREREWLVPRMTAFIGRADRVCEHEDGYSLGVEDANPEDFEEVARLIALDRLCCPFIRHAVIAEPHSRTMWLSLSGGEGVKAYLFRDIDGLLPVGAPIRADWDRLGGRV
jgi:hypothetical protein